MSSSVPANKLDFVIDLITTLDNVEYQSEDKVFVGNIGLSSLYTFQEIHDYCIQFDIDDSESDASTKKIVIPITSTGVYADIEHYLSANIRRLNDSPSKPFYLFDLKYYFSPSSPLHPTLEKVFNIANLFNKFQGIADTYGVEGNSSYLIFVGKSNLKIKSFYEVNILEQDLKNISCFIKEFIENEFHKEDRILAVKNALHQTYKNQDISLTTFLTKFDIFYRTVKGNFQLYLDKFSFDDLKNEFEETRREYTLKINKIFSEMQNQLLTLPIATVLAAGQISKYETISDFIKNSLILFGIVIFCVLLLMLVSNQRDSLTTIKKEIEVKKAEFDNSKESDHRDLFLNIYQQLNDRISKINSNLSIVEHITIIAAVLVTTVYLLRFVF